MLQQRASQIHSPLLWTNTCCSHQRDGESNIEAGVDGCLKKWVLKLISRTFHFIFDRLTEHELDHVMIGYSDESSYKSEWKLGNGWLLMK
jgi:isopentenyl-diphosphate delta-isomerase